MIGSQDQLLKLGKILINDDISKLGYSTPTDPFTIILNYRSSFAVRQISSGEGTNLQKPTINSQIQESSERHSYQSKNQKRSVSKNKIIHKFRKYTSKRQIRQRFRNLSPLEFKIQLWRQLWIPNMELSQLKRQKQQKMNCLQEENEVKSREFEIKTDNISENCKQLAQQFQIYQSPEVIDYKNYSYNENQNSFGFWNLHEVFPDYS